MAVAFTHPGDGFVVEVVTKDTVLRCDPKAVPSADHPFLLPAATELSIVVFEDVGCPGPPVGEDPGSDIKSDNQLCLRVGKPETVIPSSERDGFGSHRGGARPSDQTETRIGIST